MTTTSSLEEAKKVAQQLDILIKMAAHNSPRDTKINMKTCGTDPQASITVSSWALEILLRAAVDNLDFKL